MSAASSVVARQFDAYNSQDIDGFMACYAPGCTLGGLHGAVTETGHQAIRERHIKLFATFPQNRARLLSRLVVGNTVVDHEDVSRGTGKDQFEVIAIYTIKDGLIAHVDYAR